MTQGNVTPYGRYTFKQASVTYSVRRAWSQDKYQQYLLVVEKQHLSGIKHNSQVWKQECIKKAEGTAEHGFILSKPRPSSGSRWVRSENLRKLKWHRKKKSCFDLWFSSPSSSPMNLLFPSSVFVSFLMLTPICVIISFSSFKTLSL